MSNSHGSAHHLEVDSHSTLEVASHSHPTDASYSYPEVAHESYPEVVSQSFPGDAQHSYPEVVSQYNRDSKYQHTQVPSPGPSPVPAYSKGGYGAPVEIGEHSARDEERQPPAPPTSIWQRRKWLISGVAAVVLVIAVVAGVVGGVVGSKSANNTASPGSSNSSATPSSDGSSGSSSGSGSGSGSGTNTATGGPTSTTNAGSPTSVPTAISNPIPMAAAANTDSAGTVSIAVFYRQSASANLMYTLYTRGYGFTVTNQVALKLPVAAGSPMALTSRLNSQNNQTVLDLFYRYVDDGTTHIVMSEQVCDSGSPVCTESISGILTGNTTQQVHTQSNVAAIWIGQGSITGRVYYQAVDGSIIEANSDGAATTGWVTRTIHTGGVIGTSIAAAVYPSGPQIHVTFVDNTTGNPTDLTYTGSWSASVIDSNPGTKWNANATMAMCYVPTTSYFHWFYVSDTNGGDIVEYRRPRGSSTWAAMGTSSNLLTAQSGLGVVGWSSSMRLYHLHGITLEQGSASTGDWKTGVLPISS